MVPDLTWPEKKIRVRSVDLTWKKSSGQVTDLTWKNFSGQVNWPDLKKNSGHSGQGLSRRDFPMLSIWGTSSITQLKYPAMYNTFAKSKRLQIGCPNFQVRSLTWPELFFQVRSTDLTRIFFPGQVRSGTIGMSDHHKYHEIFWDLSSILCVFISVILWVFRVENTLFWLFKTWFAVKKCI